MPDQITDGVSFFCTRRALHKNSAMFVKLPRDANLLRIRRLTEQHFPLDQSRCDGIGCLGLLDGHFLAHNVQQGPWQIFASSEIGENTLDSGGETPGTGAEEEKRVASDAWIESVAVRRAIFDEFSSRRKLNDEAFKKGGG